MGNKTDRFGFLLLPRFPHAAFASAVDALALANYVSGQALFEWKTVADTTIDVPAQNGIRTTIDHRLEDAPDFDTITVCGGIDGSHENSATIRNWLRNRYSKGATIGSISTGSWVLARAGLLQKKRCTVHWEDLNAFREIFPTLNATSEIFEIDGRVFTCSGGSASVDLFLSFIAVRHGMNLAMSVSEQLVHGPARSTHEHQRLELRDRTGISNPILARAAKIMEAHIEHPLSLEKIAQNLGVSGRQVERLFRKYFGQTPRAYYRSIRLTHARSLLRSTDVSIQQVAYATGFCTSSYLSKCYKNEFGHLPSRERGERNLVRHINHN